MLYWSTFIILAVFAYCEKFSERFNRHKKVFIVLSFLWLFLLSTFRWEVGTDWFPYYNFFVNSLQIPLIDSQFEVGFSALNKIIRFFINNYNVFLGVLAFITQLLNKHIFCTINRHSIGGQRNLFFILLSSWGIYMCHLYPVRRSIASCICFYSLIYCFKRKPINFILSVLLATLVHRSSIIFIVAYPIYNIKIERNKLFALTVLLIVIGMLCGRHMLIIISKLLSGTTYSERIIEYVNDGIHDAQYGSVYSALFVVAKGMANIVFVLICSFIAFNGNKQNRHFRGCVNIYCFGSILFASLIIVNPTFASLGNIFIQVQLVIFVGVLNGFKKRQKIIMVIFIVYFAARMYATLNAYDEGIYYPYKTVFGSNK